MYALLTNLIDHTFYKTNEVALTKVDTLYAYGKLTEDEYGKLIALIKEKYPEATTTSSSGSTDTSSTTTK